jgi:hypothetical protein
MLPSLTTITVSVSSEPPALLPKIPLEIKASYSLPNAGDSAKEQKQQVRQPPPLRSQLLQSTICFFVATATTPMRFTESAPQP